MGSGWQQFGRIFGGPGGRIYGLKTGGLMEYRWAGTGFAGAARNITTTFNGFVSGANRSRITSDASGAIYAITGSGADGLYRYVIDNTQGKIVATQLVGLGWATDNLIVGAGNGVIYSRDPAGVLYRTSFDPASHRLIENRKQVATGWNQFSKVVSVGADILLGVQSDGRMFQFRYDESNSTWPISGRLIGSGWESFFDLPSIADDCQLNVSHSPAPTSPPAETGAPLAVHVTADGKQIDYSYVDSRNGEVKWGHQRDSTIFDQSSVVWPPAPLTTANYVGVPSMLTFNTAQVAIFAQSDDGKYWSTSQPSVGTETLTGWRPEGGTMAGGTSYDPDINSLGRQAPEDPHHFIPALQAIDDQGQLWQTARSAPDFFETWKAVGTGGMVGTPATVLRNGDGLAFTIARNSSGGLTGSLNDEGQSSLPDSARQFDLPGIAASNSRISLVNEGRKTRMFVRDTSGAIMTNTVDYSDQQVLIGQWTKIGDTTTLTGSPSSVFIKTGDGDDSGTTVITARGTDGQIYYAFATNAHVFGPWRHVTSSNTNWYGDPTIFSYQSTTGLTWAVTSYTQDYQVYAFINPPLNSNKAGSRAIPSADGDLTPRLIKSS